MWPNYLEIMKNVDKLSRINGKMLSNLLEIMKNVIEARGIMKHGIETCRKRDNLVRIKAPAWIFVVRMRGYGMTGFQWRMRYIYLFTMNVSIGFSVQYGARKSMASACGFLSEILTTVGILANDLFWVFFLTRWIWAQGVHNASIGYFFIHFSWFRPEN